MESPGPPALLPQKTGILADAPKKSRGHLINGSKWRGQRFWLATRSDAGRIPAAGFNRGTTTWPGKRSAASVRTDFGTTILEDHRSRPIAAARIYEMASKPKSRTLRKKSFRWPPWFIICLMLILQINPPFLKNRGHRVKLTQKSSS